MASARSGQLPAQSLIVLRSLAAQVLAQVYNTKDSLDEAVTQVLIQKSSATFPEFDRAWLFEICSGVLRYKGRLDYIIDTYALKKKPTGKLRRFLQIGAFQLIGQDVEPALAVSESVEAIRKSEGDAPSKFANALLRKIADSRQDWIHWKVSEQSPFEEQLAWCSLPEWLFKKLRKERGSPWVFAFSESVLKRPDIWYRTPDQSFKLESGYQGNEPYGFVQDISNQKLVDEVAKKLGSLAIPSPRILDLCSAPGGKSMGLAFKGYSVTATDFDESRLQRVFENRNRLKLEAKITIEPFEKIWNSSSLYHLIWVDAPCSSIGIIRRHPEIKWNRNEEDVLKLVQKQADLINWSRKHLEPGGVLVYSTCSLLQSENPGRYESSTGVTRLEWVPQDEPYGDGIVATLIS